MMKKPTNPTRIPISGKAIVYTTDNRRNVIDVSAHTHDADLANLRFQDYKRVARGGDWYTPSDYLRSGGRAGIPPAAQDDRIGFRLVFQERKK